MEKTQLAEFEEVMLGQSAKAVHDVVSGFHIGHRILLSHQIFQNYVKANSLT